MLRVTGSSIDSPRHNYLAGFSSQFSYDETVNFHECHVTREILVGLGNAVSCICISYSSWTTARSFIMCLLHVQRRCQNHSLKCTSSRFPRRWSSLESSGFWRLLTLLPLFRWNLLSPLSTTKRYLQNKQTNKIRDLSPRANYTDRAAAACRRS
jgi:hypothetical protein